MYPTGGGKRPLSGAGDRASEIQHVSLTSGMNVLIGVNSGTMAISRGNYNVHVGSNAGSSATYMQSGVLVGSKAGESATRMSNVVGVGAGVLAQGYAVYDSVMVGSGSGANLRRSKENAFAGYMSGGQLASATKSTLIGCHAGYVGRNFVETTFVGSHAGLEGNYVTGCVGIGSFAAAGIGDAANITVVGANVAIYAVGNNNVYLGFENAANAVGSNNVFVGREAGKFAEVNDSIIIGDRAGQYAVGSNVVIIGGGGSGGNTSPTGNGSTILGSGAGANATGDFATDIGYDAGRNWVGDRVTFLGASAGSARGVGDDAVGVGAGSLDGGALGNSFTSVGSNSGYAAVGDDCVFVGSGAGASSDGDRNVAIGLDVLSGTTGSNNVVVGTGVTTSSLQSSVVVGKDLNLSGAASEIVVIGSNVSTASAPYTGGVYLGSDFAVSNEDNESLVVAMRGQRVISANSTHTVVGNASDPYFSANSKGDIAVGTSTNPTLRSNTKYIGIGSPSDPYFYATSLGDARVGQVGSTALFANTTSFQLGPGATIMNVTTTGAEMGYPYTLFANPTFTNGNSATDSYGTWTCTSNTTAANASTYYAFDGDSGTFYNSEVHTYSSSGSSWSPEIPTTQGTLATISGLWIQLEIPTERHIAFIRVVDSTDGTYLLYGSNDGATFSYVSSVTDDKSFGDPSQTTSYKYYRLIDAAPLSPSDGETFEMKIYEIVMSFWDETTGSDYFSANAIDGTVQLGPSGTTVYATPSVMMLGGTTAPYLTANAAGDFLVGRGSNAVTISKGSIYTFTGEVVAGGPSVGRYANFRVYHPYRSTIFISDSLNFSLVYTANGDPLGKYTDARPFMVNYNTGSVTVGTPLVVSNALQLYNDADIVLSSRGDGSKEDEFININGNLYAIGWRPGNSINFSIPDADNRWFLWRKKNSSYKASNIMTLASNGNLTTAGDIFMGGDTLSIRQSGYDIYSIVNSSKLSFSTRGGFYWGNSTGEDFLYINSAGELQLYGNIARKQTAGAWFGPSDMHLKTGIETANVEICYDTVKSLRLVRHGWIPEFDGGQDRKVLGWIAQEVQEVLPKTIVDDGKHLLLDPTQIYHTMYGAVQRLMQKVEALEEEVVTLRELVCSS